MHRWVVLVVALAGCTQAADPPVEAPDAPEDAGWYAIVPPGASNATAARSLSGTFSLQDSNRLPGGEPTQTHDLADLVAAGTLFTMVVEAEAGTSGDIDIGIVNGDGEGYETSCECPLGPYNLYTYTGIMGDRLDVVIQYDETGQEESFEYTIEVDAFGHGLALPAGAPMAIELDAGDAVAIAESSPVVVFDGEDRRVAELAGGTFTATARGEHVFMGRVPGSPFTMTTNASDAPVRMLTTDTVQSEPQMPESGFSTNFTAPADTISVGVCLLVDEFAQDPSIRLTGPAGVLFEDSGSGPFFAQEWGVCYESDTGDPAAGAGEYLLEADRERGVNGQVFYFITSFGR